MVLCVGCKCCLSNKITTNSKTPNDTHLQFLSTCKHALRPMRPYNAPHRHCREPALRKGLFAPRLLSVCQRLGRPFLGQSSNE